MDEGLKELLEKDCGQHLSTVISNYLICDNCRFVFNDDFRDNCPNCNNHFSCGTLYFKLSVDKLIDLMQEFYQTSQKGTSIVENDLSKEKDNHHLAVVVFFCSLVEVLLDNFLEYNMRERKIPESVLNRLLDDNMFIRQRIDKLFPSLIGMSWKDAIKSVNNNFDYSNISEFCKEVADARNRFLHNGYAWVITEKMAEQCFENLSRLIELFVDLHNKFNRPGQEA